MGKFADALEKLADEIQREDALRVVAAAVRGDDGNVYYLDPPARHHKVIRYAREQGYTGPVGGDRQGFLLNNGQFAGRRPALYIAQRSKQLIRKPIAPGHGLFSEDVW